MVTCAVDPLHASVRWSDLCLMRQTLTNMHMQLLKKQIGHKAFKFEVTNCVFIMQNGNYFAQMTLFTPSAITAAARAKRLKLLCHDTHVCGGIRH